MICFFVISITFPSLPFPPLPCFLFPVGLWFPVDVGTHPHVCLQATATVSAFFLTLGVILFSIVLLFL